MEPDAPGLSLNTIEGKETVPSVISFSLQLLKNRLAANGKNASDMRPVNVLYMPKTDTG
jgi:hypothetical protein